MSERPLVIDDDRYSRLRLIAWWDQEKLAQARVLVVGAGALGNEVLKNLALMGLGHIYIVDFDQIEESNLTRSVLFRRNDCGRSKAEAAASALKDLNPDLEILALHADILTDLGLGMVAEMDVVMGCLDNREARLWLNRMCWKTGTPWIDASDARAACGTYSPLDMWRSASSVSETAPPRASDHEKMGVKPPRTAHRIIVS